MANIPHDNADKRGDRDDLNDRDDRNKPAPKPSRGLSRAMLYALIPGGFILLVVLLTLFGWTRDEPAPMEAAREQAEERTE